MKRFATKFFSLIIAFTLALGFSGNMFTQVQSSSYNSVTLSGLTYSQNFDALGSSPNASNLTFPWAYDSTIPGWYLITDATINVSAYLAGNGSTTNGSFYSYGSALASDRALGGLASNGYYGASGTGKGYLGLALNNQTGDTITGFTVTYTGEQWRNGGNTSTQNLLFEYKISASGPTNSFGFSTSSTGWTNVPALTFASPIASASATALDGNASANKLTLTSTISGISLINGEHILLRWIDLNDSGNDHGLAIDDLAIIFTTTPDDTAPNVSSITPAGGSTNFATDSDITVTFSEAVNVSSAWVTIECTTSGSHVFTISGGPTTFTINPDADFGNSETCTVTIIAAQISDEDSNDPPDVMAADYVSTFTTIASAPPLVVISQVYGGGGNSGATYRNDFIELFNRGTAAVDLTGWSVQYASSTGSTWQVTNLSGTIQPGAYWLVQEAQGSGGTVALPTPNNTGTIAMAATNGKVALSSSTTALIGTCPTGLVDFVGYGTANCSETSPTAALTNTTAALRNNNGATDTDNNLADFTVGAPNPRNTPPPDIAPTIVSTYPADLATDVPMSASITVTFSEAVIIASGGVSVSCANSGMHLVGAVMSAGDTIITLDPTVDFDPLETCTVTVTASAVTDQDVPLDNLASDYTFSFTTMADPCTLPYTSIYTIQGSGDTMALTGSQTTMGVVVGDFEGASPALRGFFIQDPAGDGNTATSDGIFIFEGSNANTVNLGDWVRVSGTAAEYQGQSQISVGTPVVCGTGYSVTPTVVDLPVADLTFMERYEGMLVTFPEPLFVTENYYLGRFGQVTVSGGDRLDQPTAVTDPGAPAIALAAANQLNKVIVDDSSQTQNPDPIVFGRGGLPLSASNTLRGGDSITGLTGVMTYTWSGDATSGNTWRVRPVTSMSGYYNFAATNPRPTAVPAVGGTATIVGMNVLNYFNTFGTSSCTYGVNGGVTECRGAENITEFNRQWAKIVAAITALNPDVLGVVEIENDGYGVDSALQDLVNKLNAATSPGTYAFIDVDANTGIVDAMGTDAIKNAIIYKPASVTPVGTTAVLNTVAFVNGGDPAPRNRVSVMQAFEDNDTSAVFLVDVNHLKSKGSACSDPDLGDGQGNCNIVRLNGVYELLSWFGTDPTGTADPDIIMLGDLNSYAKEDPIVALEAAGFINSAHAFLGDAAYSYVFNENVGGLDYAMVSPSFYSQTSGVQEWHINADEPIVLDYNTNYKSAGQIDSLYDSSYYRMSDHDPVVVGFNPDGTWPTAGITDPVDGAVLAVGIHELTAVFSKDVMHDGGLYAADNPSNYILVEDGVNHLWDTLACGGIDNAGPQPDDVEFSVDSVVYDPATLTAVLTVNSGIDLPNGRYRLFVCGTGTIRDLAGNSLNNGAYDTFSTFRIGLPTAAEEATLMPSTGFAPDRVTDLPAQTASYAGLGDLWLEIPSLKVKTAIVGVPISNSAWDVTWLGNQAGWLEGSSYPTALGNSVLTAHVWDALNKPGTFFALNKLQYGQTVIVHSYGKEYVYEVRQVMQVKPKNVDAMLKHQEDAWLTLVTCQGWDEAADDYNFRVLVRAVLVDVR